MYILGGYKYFIILPKNSNNPPRGPPYNPPYSGTGNYDELNNNNDNKSDFGYGYGRNPPHRPYSYENLYRKPSTSL